jgi:YVTN family beta-propeller protein
MRSILFFLVCMLLCTITFSQSLPHSVQLPNGWKLSPAGTGFVLGDLPLNIEVSPSGKYAAVTNNGQGTQTLQIIETASRKKTDSLVVNKLWYGLAFTRDEKFLYAAAGHNNMILKYSFTGGKLKLADSLVLGKRWPERIGPAGIAIDEKRNRLYTVTREDKKLYIVDLKTKQVVNALQLDAEGYACKISKDNMELFITCWGCDKLLTYDLEKNSWKEPIAVGDNPNEILLTPNGKLLYVCNANDNTVSVIDIKSRQVIETLDAALFPQSPSGSTPNSLALDVKKNILYIANADNNCIAVFDVSKPGASMPKGFIPTGWYPTCVRMINGKIWVSNGKGFTSKPNPFGPAPTRKREDVIHHGFETRKGSDVEYIAALFTGTMSVIDVPSEKVLKDYSAAVYRNSPYADYKNGAAGEADFVASRQVKHIFYIIKENRTYDQVLSDVKGGNGDTTLLLFGKKVTPNQHKLVESFVLLDNFFVDAEVSADGHNWSMGAYATDYMEKTWPTSYGGRGGTYGGEGEREIGNNKMFIWDNCKRSGVTYRTYGEFADEGKATVKVLDGHVCPTYAGYDLSVRDTARFYAWKKEFATLLKTNSVPQFNTMRFGNDHTEGMRLGRLSPYAHVADNDYAVGLFIEHLAASPIWNESVVFILEDDAQNGADHVDAHRSTAYIAGGLIKRNFIDHTAYTTSSMLRTMELLLGMEPMTQYDAAAKPMWNCFMPNAMPSDFKSIAPRINLEEKNVAINIWQKKSEAFNFKKEDANNDVEFNRVLWHGLKGDVPFPGPTRAAFVVPVAGDDDDD